MQRLNYTKSNVFISKEIERTEEKKKSYIFYAYEKLQPISYLSYLHRNVSRPVKMSNLTVRIDMQSQNASLIYHFLV